MVRTYLRTQTHTEKPMQTQMHTPMQTPMKPPAHTWTTTPTCAHTHAHACTGHTLPLCFDILVLTASDELDSSFYAVQMIEICTWFHWKASDDLFNFVDGTILGTNLFYVGSQKTYHFVNYITVIHHSMMWNEQLLIAHMLVQIIIFWDLGN